MEETVLNEVAAHGRFSYYLVDAMVAGGILTLSVAYAGFAGDVVFNLGILLVVLGAAVERRRE
jgi:hypothetical protein